ncbi:MAG TPA: hypothetical protein ENG69_05860 [Candidatus Korarchaeota archaeon]|nr:hypothetical protein [Candidatus Korarchaeota archaeon]
MTETVVFSVRISRELRERMKKVGVDWRAEIEKFIEERLKEEEFREAIRSVKEALKGVEPSGEPAWKTIRESREGR